MSTPKDPAAKPTVPPRRGSGFDDDEEPWRHPPVAPKDQNPLDSLGESISETVTGPLADKPGKPKA